MRQSLQAGERYAADNMILKNIILSAYELRSYQLFNAPGWIENTHFDIAAKAEKPVTRNEMLLLVQSLLEDRFGLVVKREQREMPIHELVLDRTDGKLGPGLVQPASDADCDSAVQAKRGELRLPPGSVLTRGCSSTAFAMIASASTSMAVQTHVIDKTGLVGTWMYHFYYAPPSRGGIDTSSANLPIYTTALREQLGLRLKPARGPVDVVVIESVKMPTDD